MTSTDLPPLDTPSQVTAELRWVAHEARELVDSTDQERIERYLARKAALRERIEAQR